MDRFETARALILQAGRALRGTRVQADAVWQKTGKHDLVTRCDRETELFLRRGILDAFAQDAIIGEEFAAEHTAGAEYQWYLDPIDGTTNFVSQHRNYAISIGCYRGLSPVFGLVLDVERDVLYSAQAGCGAHANDSVIRARACDTLSDALLTAPGIPHTFLTEQPHRAGLVRLAQAVRGVRSMGSVALELCAVAAGEADLFVTRRSCPWDHNAARIILSEAGGCLCTLDGGAVPCGQNSTLLGAGTHQLLQYALDVLHSAQDDV